MNLVILIHAKAKPQLTQMTAESSKYKYTISQRLFQKFPVAITIFLISCCMFSMLALLIPLIDVMFSLLKNISEATAPHHYVGSPLCAMPMWHDGREPLPPPQNLP